MATYSLRDEEALSEVEGAGGDGEAVASSLRASFPFALAEANVMDADRDAPRGGLSSIFVAIGG